MTIYYFVRDKNRITTIKKGYAEYPDRRIYLQVNKISDIPIIFTLDNNHTYSIKEIEVEGSKLDVYIPMIVFGLLGLLIHPLGGIIGVTIGFVLGLYQMRINDIKINKAREELMGLYK